MDFFSFEIKFLLICRFNVKIYFNGVIGVNLNQVNGKTGWIYRDSIEFYF